MERNVVAKEALFEKLIIRDVPLNEIASEYNLSCAELYKILSDYKLLREHNMPPKANKVCAMRTCGYCGKAFNWNPEWVYKLTYKTTTIYFHRYNCQQNFIQNYKERKNKSL